MFCINCGTQIASDDRFCAKCGTATKPTIAQTAPNFPSLTQRQYLFSPAANHLDDRVLDPVYSTGRSGLFLTATLFFTLVQLLALINTLLPTTALASIIFGALIDVGLSWSDAEDIADLFRNGSFFYAMSFVSLLPGILTMIGMWMVYTSCRNKQRSTAGLTLIQVNMVLTLISICIVCIVTFVFLINIGNDIDILSDIPPVLYLILLGIAALPVVYYAKICKTIAAVKKTLQNGTVDQNISTFVAVCCILLGCFGFIKALYSLISLNFLGALSDTATAFAALLMGMLLFSYKRKMREVEYETTSSNSYSALKTHIADSWVCQYCHTENSTQYGQCKKCARHRSNGFQTEEPQNTSKPQGAATTAEDTVAIPTIKTTWECAQCGTVNETKYSQCKKCGKYKSDSKSIPVIPQIEGDDIVCPICETKQRNDRKVCWSCGQKFIQE